MNVQLISGKTRRVSTRANDKTVFAGYLLGARFGFCFIFGDRMV